MPVATAKTAKRRIKSIANTMKITKAMELVSAAKMRRAVQSTLATRPFATLSWQTIRAVAKVAPSSHPLLRENTNATKHLLVLFTADRGLAGGFNSNVLKATLKTLTNGETDIIAIGRRGADTLARKGFQIIARFEGFTNKPKFEDLLPIGRMIIDKYTAGDYRSVTVAYTDFVSGLVQKPRLITLLPFSAPTDVEQETSEMASEYVFEPDPQAVVQRVLPRLIETMLYQALLESAASEHSARMLAMRNATDSAKDMLADLKFTFNQIRQAGITREIAEISSGKAALE